MWSMRGDMCQTSGTIIRLIMPKDQSTLRTSVLCVFIHVYCPGYYYVGSLRSALKLQYVEEALCNFLCFGRSLST